jgi:hypothetical protein
VERSKQVLLDGSFRRAQNGGDLEQIHVLDKPKHEDGALSFREFPGCRPYRLKLFLEKGGRFRGRISRGQEVPEFVHANRGGLGTLPELKTTATRQVANEICGDLHKPGLDCGIAAESIPMTKSTDEAILSQALRVVSIAQGRENEPEYDGSIELNDTVEVLELFGGMLDRCGDCCQGNRFHQCV